MKLLAFVMLIVTCAGCSSVVEHPEFAKRRAGIRQIAVVSPNVEFHCQTPESRQGLPDKETELRTELIAAMTRELTAKGFVVELPKWKSLATATNVNWMSLSQSEAVDRATERTNFYTFIRRRHPDQRSTPEQKADARLLATLAAADAIAFVQLNGYTNTAQQQATVAIGNVFDFLFAAAGGAAGVPVGGGNFQAFYGMTSVQLMLVEGRSGEPLWTNLVSSRAEHPNLDKLVKELLDPLPKASARTEQDFPNPKSVARDSKD